MTAPTSAITIDTDAAAETATSLISEPVEMTDAVNPRATARTRTPATATEEPKESETPFVRVDVAETVTDNVLT